MQPFHNFWWFKLYVSTIIVGTLGILWCGLAITHETHRWSGCIREPSGRDHRLQGVETRGCWCWPLQFQWIAPFWMDSTIGYTAWSPIITNPGGHFSRFFFVSTVRQLCCAAVRLLISFSWLWFTEHTYTKRYIFPACVLKKNAFFEWSPPWHSIWHIVWHSSWLLSGNLTYILIKGSLVVKTPCYEILKMWRD